MRVQHTNNAPDDEFDDDNKRKLCERIGMHIIDIVLLFIIFAILGLCIAKSVQGIASACASCGSKRSCPAHTLGASAHGPRSLEALKAQNVCCPMTQDVLARMERKLGANASSE